MDNREFLNAVQLLVKEKGIDENIVYEAMEQALTNAYKKHNNQLANVRVVIDKDRGDIRLYSYMTVVEEITDPRVEYTLEEAREIVPDIQIGETIEEEVDTKEFGRVAASSAKQVVVQKIREAEKNLIIEEYQDKADELVSGSVELEDNKNYYIDLGKTQGILPKSECIPGETIKMSTNIKVYITKVITKPEKNDKTKDAGDTKTKAPKGPVILLSRNHFGFVKRLFELEIPEINEGIILVYSVAREAGNRTKIAVYSENPNVDPIGACIGEKGMRIANILKELGEEKVDVVEYNSDPVKFIENALSPAKNLHVFVTDEKKKEAMVIVDQENLSLAIGKKGLNVRLAARLTHYKIDVKTYEQAREEGINIIG